MTLSNSNRERSEKVGDRIRIFQRGTTWYATYQDGRQQKRVSLKTSNKKNAHRLALELDRRLADGESPKKRRDCSIAEAIAAYDEYLVAEQRSPKTLSKYRFVLGLVIELGKRTERQSLSQVDLTFVDKFRAERARTCAPKTVYNNLYILRQLVKFAISRRMIANDPLVELKIKKCKPTPQPCFDPEQIDQILATASESHRPTFLLLAETGLRFGEAQWLTWLDVDLKRNILHVRAKDGWKTKTGDERVVPLSPRLATFLTTHPRRARWVLTATPTSQHPSVDRQISERRLLVALKRVLRRLGIDGKLHTFRHAFISRCLTLGIEESVVRSWVGHVDSAIMRLYTHISSPISQDRIKRLTLSPATTAATS